MFFFKLVSKIGIGVLLDLVYNRFPRNLPLKYFYIKYRVLKNFSTINIPTKFAPNIMYFGSKYKNDKLLLKVFKIYSNFGIKPKINFNYFTNKASNE